MLKSNRMFFLERYIRSDSTPRHRLHPAFLDEWMEKVAEVEESVVVGRVCHRELNYRIDSPILVFVSASSGVFDVEFIFHHSMLLLWLVLGL